MTNLIATLSVIVQTNWNPVARITPIVPPDEVTLAVYRPVRIREQAWVVTNLIATIEHKGLKHSVVIETLGSAAGEFRERVDKSPFTLELP